MIIIIALWQGQLTDCEQQLLEKELLLEQIVRLLGRAQKKADARKETTQQVGTKINHYQSKLRELTCKMMAHISELSVQQVRGVREEGRERGR